MTTYVCATIDTATQACSSWVVNVGLLDVLAITPTQAGILITAIFGYWSTCLLLKEARKGVQ